MTEHSIQSFYFFKKIPESQLFSIRNQLMDKAGRLSVSGLIILAGEGLNATLSSMDEDKLNQFVVDIKDCFGEKVFKIKKSTSRKKPFRRFSIKIRDEIVTMKRPDIFPVNRGNHLSPEKWHEMMKKEDVILIDVRNDYEYSLGTFEKATHLNIKEFSQFPEKIHQFQSDKNKPHLIFCTGGIRCEKAIYEMMESGYKNTFQLDGGILNYIQQYPEGYFKGECFVFDSRASVDKRLKASEIYSLCPHCGDIGSLDINCRKCDSASKLCRICMGKAKTNPEYETCSKNCRYHYLHSPHKKGPRQKQFYHY